MQGRERKKSQAVRYRAPSFKMESRPLIIKGDNFQRFKASAAIFPPAENTESGCAGGWVLERERHAARRREDPYRHRKSTDKHALSEPAGAPRDRA